MMRFTPVAVDVAASVTTGPGGGVVTSLPSRSVPLLSISSTMSANSFVSSCAIFRLLSSAAVPCTSFDLEGSLAILTLSREPALSASSTGNSAIALTLPTPVVPASTTRSLPDLVLILTTESASLALNSALKVSFKTGPSNNLSLASGALSCVINSAFFVPSGIAPTSFVSFAITVFFLSSLSAFTVTRLSRILFFCSAGNCVIVALSATGGGAGATAGALALVTITCKSSSVFTGLRSASGMGFIKGIGLVFSFKAFFPSASGTYAEGIKLPSGSILPTTTTSTILPVASCILIFAVSLPITAALPRPATTAAVTAFILAGLITSPDPLGSGFLMKNALDFSGSASSASKSVLAFCSAGLVSGIFCASSFRDASASVLDGSSLNTVPPSINPNAKSGNVNAGISVILHSHQYPLIIGSL